MSARRVALRYAHVGVILVVGLDDARTTACRKAANALGLVLVQASHGPAAAEWMNACAPRLVILSSTLFSEERLAISDAAWHIGSPLFQAGTMAAPWLAHAIQQAVG